MFGRVIVCLPFLNVQTTIFKKYYFGLNVCYCIIIMQGDLATRFLRHVFAFSFMPFQKYINEYILYNYFL